MAASLAKNDDANTEIKVIIENANVIITAFFRLSPHITTGDIIIQADKTGFSMNNPDVSLF